MVSQEPAVNISTSPHSTNWGAIFSVTLGVASMITSELLPVSLLTPMAEGLNITEGMAGQSVSLTALVAIFSSLLITTLTRGMNRKWVVVSFSLLLAASNLLTAVAPNYLILLGARFVLGIGMGGFWAMAASLAMRLSAPKDVSKALSIIFGGVSISLVIAAPAGSLLETVLGWRGVFGVASALGGVCILWQFIVLPSIPSSENNASVASVLRLFSHRGVSMAMLAILLVFAAQMGVLTYIRPLLEKFAGFSVSGITTLLLLFGLANFAGTSFSSFILARSLRLGITVPPLVTALALTGILISSGNQYVTGAAIIFWGFSCGIVPVAWSTWITQQFSDDAEKAGSLQVAVIQFANTAGAAVGGVVFDYSGETGPVVMGVLLMLATAAISGLKVRTRQLVATETN
jgi:MFS transporter, DHA1 family, purine ribonucleoside efflux pump